MEEFKPVLAKKKKDERLKQKVKSLEESMAELIAKTKALEDCNACSKIKELTDTINELQGKDDSKTTSSAASIEDSEILKGDPSYLKALGDFLKPVVQSNSHWKRCWRASVDGWASTTFHTNCDNKGPTVTIVRVGKYIFGGYANISWTSWSHSGCEWKYDPAAFLFSLVNKPGWQPLKLDQTGEFSAFKYSITTCSSYGPRFGGGDDIRIVDNASSSTKSYSDLGHTYSPPTGYSYKSSFARSFLAGSYNFQPDEVEVFYETT
ncbi:hypothetical protein ACROYT_G032396 [Oculina patagonica]